MPSPTLFLNDFTVLDFAFGDAELGIAGESFYVSAELAGTLDAQDFLLDFGAAKRLLKALVDEELDHKLLLPMGSGAIALTEGGLSVRSAAGDFVYECPRSAYVPLPDSQLSAEGLALHLARLARTRLPANVSTTRFHLRTEARFAAEANFRYTHGLRFHDGNCQRLFHGHRNPIEVWCNGRRDASWEQRLATEWADAHFLSLPSLRNAGAQGLRVGEREPGRPGVVDVEYESSQGRFRGQLPAGRVVLTDAEPSIETLARIAHRLLRSRGVEGELRVVAYEGLNKGASFTDLSGNAFVG